MHLCCLTTGKTPQQAPQDQPGGALPACPKAVQQGRAPCGLQARLLEGSLNADLSLSVQHLITQLKDRYDQGTSARVLCCSLDIARIP